MPIYVMMIGLPGSGKSTVAQAIKDMFPNDWRLISTDKYIEEIVYEKDLPYDVVFKDHIDEATKRMKSYRTYCLERSRNIIHDQTNLTIKSRAGKLSDIPKRYTTIGLVCNIDETERQRRLTLRPDKTIPRHVDKQMRDTVQWPISEFKEFDYLATYENWPETLKSVLALAD